MTDQNLVEVVVIMDRSGSMETIKKDMEGGLKKFAEEQRALPGKCVLSLYRFDNEFDTVFEEKNVRDIPEMKLEPRGTTALLDAVGRTIIRVGERLKKKSESERPGGVIVMVITDGQENSSTEFSKAKVREMIEHQTKNYNWKFLYLGADASAFSEGHAMGFSSIAQYSANAIGTRALYQQTSGSIGDYRGQLQRGIGAQNATLNMPNVIKPGN